MLEYLGYSLRATSGLEVDLSNGQNGLHIVLPLFSGSNEYGQVAFRVLPIWCIVRRSSSVRCSFMLSPAARLGCSCLMHW